MLQGSSSSVVDFTKTVDCCVVGEASTCIPENTNGLADYCKNAITPSKNLCKNYLIFSDKKENRFFLHMLYTRIS